MTCIVGVADGQKVTIGGDSAAGGNGWDVQRRRDPKVFRNGPYLIGYTSSFRMGQLLRYRLDPPEPEQPLHRSLATDFVDAVRDCLEEGGWRKVEDEREEGGRFLVGVQGRLFKVDPDFHVADPLGQQHAVGCGRRYALGALHALRGKDAETKVRTALQAAADNSGGVRRPFTVLDTGP